LGLGLFLDFGNTFGWYIEEENKIKIKWSDYITKLAVGTGFGLRYETPIGPIRIDFATPLYDPMKKRKAFWDLVFVFGIGHAF
jgi:outer membrane translocation and assembly module TamA